MNQDVIWCVLILVLLCVIGAIGCGLWLNSYDDLSEPFKQHDDKKEAFLAFWTFVIILQVLIIFVAYFFMVKYLFSNWMIGVCPCAQFPICFFFLIFNNNLAQKFVNANRVWTFYQIHQDKSALMNKTCLSGITVQSMLSLSNSTWQINEVKLISLAEDGVNRLVQQ